MVILKIAEKALSLGLRYGPRVIGAEQKILRGVGYTHKSAKGISHGLFAGAVVGNLIGLTDPINDDNNGKVPIKNGTASYKPNKARSGFYRRNFKKYSVRCKPYRSNRYSNSSKYYRR